MLKQEKRLLKIPLKNILLKWDGLERMGAIADANKKIKPKIDTLILPTKQEFGHISSTAVRDLLIHNKDIDPFQIHDFMVISKDTLLEYMNKNKN